MIITMLPQKIVTIYLGLNLITTMSFPERINTIVYGGGKDELFTEKVNHDKTLIFKPLKEKVKSNLLVVTQSKEYYFYIEENGWKPHDFVIIQDGKLDQSFTVMEEQTDYRILEGENTIRVENRLKEKIMVNGEEIEKAAIFGKGTTLVYQNRRIYN